MQLPSAFYRTVLSDSGAAPWQRSGHSQSAQEYGLSTLTGRAFLHQTQPLLSPNQDEKRLETMAETVERLSKKKGGSIGGRQLYFKDLMAVLADWKTRKHRVSDLKSGHKVMALHGTYYKELSASRKRAYETQAALAMSRKEIEREEALEEARAALQLEKVRQAEQAVQRSPLLVGSCNLSDQSLEGLQAQLDSGEFSQSKVQTLRAAASVAPELPDAAHHASLSHYPVWADPRWRRRPHWLGTLCRERDGFLNTAVVFQTGSAEFLQQVSLCHAEPLLRLLLDEPYLPVCEAESVSEDIVTDGWIHTFKIDFMNFQDHVDLVFPTAKLFVMPGLVYIGGNTVVSDGSLIRVPQRATTTRG